MTNSLFMGKNLTIAGLPVECLAANLDLGGHVIAVTPRTTKHLLDWCAHHQDHGAAPQPTLARFAIAVYQVSQALSWRETDAPREVLWQSYCSAAMHAAMAAHSAGGSLERWLPETLDDLPHGFPGWEGFVVAQGRAMQMVVYGLEASKATTRSARYSLADLEERLAAFARSCLSLVPPERREEMCHQEMLILTKDLARAKDR